MKHSWFSITLTVSILFTFVIPFIQLSIGFHYVVKDGEDANARCAAATDLPLLLAIGGIFALFSLGTSYSFLQMITSKNQQSDMAGRVPRILIGEKILIDSFFFKIVSSFLGLVSLIFLSHTMIFFILIQMRVFRAYANDVQFTQPSMKNYCHSTVMRGALVMIILTYISIGLFLGIFLVCLLRRYRSNVTSLPVPPANTRL